MSDGQARRAVLLPAGEDDGDFERLAIAGDLYLDLVAGFSGAQGVGEVVEILNRLAVEFGQNVTPLEAGFGGGRVLADVAELDADGAFGEIGDAAEVGAVAGDGTSAHIARVRRGRGQLDERGALGRIAQALGY